MGASTVLQSPLPCRLPRERRLSAQDRSRVNLRSRAVMLDRVCDGDKAIAGTRRRDRDPFEGWLPHDTMKNGLAIDTGPSIKRETTMKQMTVPFLADPAFRSSVLTKIKLGRIGSVEDLMGALVYLAVYSRHLMG